MRAWHSYTSTVKSVRTPWTWIRTSTRWTQVRNTNQIWINILKRQRRRNKTFKITNREVLSYRLHLFAGIDVVLMGFPVGFHSLQRFSQDLGQNKFMCRLMSGSWSFMLQERDIFLNVKSTSSLFFSLTLCNLYGMTYAKKQIQETWELLTAHLGLIQTKSGLVKNLI